jgi:hypothetical protein
VPEWLPQTGDPSIFVWSHDIISVNTKESQATIIVLKRKFMYWMLLETIKEASSQGRETSELNAAKVMTWTLASVRRGIASSVTSPANHPSI